MRLKPSFILAFMPCQAAVLVFIRTQWPVNADQFKIESFEASASFYIELRASPSLSLVYSPTLSAVVCSTSRLLPSSLVGSTTPEHGRCLVNVPPGPSASAGRPGPLTDC